LIYSKIEVTILIIKTKIMRRKMKALTNKDLSINERNQIQTRNKERKVEISIYSLLVVVTVALMILVINLLLLDA